MQFLDFKSLLYSDTLIPDIFISEFLPALNSEYVKLYIYCVFLAKYNKNPPLTEIASVLDIPADTVKQGFTFLDNLGLISWTDDGVVIKDLKEAEINRHFRPKTLSTPEEASKNADLHEKRRQVIDAINNKFFSGGMSPTWYLDIDTLFDNYKFEEDVMLLLFTHCNNHNGLSKHYIAKVAESWFNKGIRTSFDVDAYMREYKAFKEISKKVQKKLNLKKPLDEYQEGVVDKWVSKYKFSFEIIELALKKSLDAPNAGFSYYDKILGDWFNRGLDTVEKITADREAGSKKIKVSAKSTTGISVNYEQREYDDEFYNTFISSGFGKKKE